MANVLDLVVLFCLVFWTGVSAAPLRPTGHTVEHIVIVNSQHPSPPAVADLLQRIELHPDHSSVRHVYNNSAFHGFAAYLQDHHLQSLARMSDVSLVEQAVTVSHAASSKPSKPQDNTRKNSPWGLERISRSSPVNGSVSALDFTYSYADSDLGKGSDIYVIDTGIYTDNDVFGGRASMLWSFDGNMEDLDGHGTHVSGTAGGNYLGVASNANLFGLKALGTDGQGSSSSVVKGIDKVIAAHDARKTSVADFRGSVISMSLSTGGTNNAINTAVKAAIAHGVHVCVAAGNDNADACGYSPSSVGGTQGGAIAVGAIDISTERTVFTNYGNCVDVYAPGMDVISAWIGGPQMVNMISGTSMATPHVTGLVAYAMANKTLAENPALMKEWVQKTALSMSSGVLVANNGVQGASGTSDEKLQARHNSKAVAGTASKRDGSKLSDMLSRFSTVFTNVHVFPRDMDEEEEGC